MRPGSSPRARGGLLIADLADLPRRLIPACAGRTWWTGPPRRGGPAHPRVRGEDSGSRRMIASSPGSSPRARGGRRSASTSGMEARLIPACAGRTPSRRRSTSTASAHPRVRGEDHVGQLVHDGEYGSSPRARGGLPDARPRVLGDGLIPACAGRTDLPASASSPTPAHPRVRGEDPRSSASQSMTWGSSPRARGGQPLRREGPRRRGLIPACAGRTVVHVSTVRHARAHPRVRGEDPATVAALAAASGSSPRARGGRAYELEAEFVPGLIPACAGRTPSSSPPSSSRRAHPRVRGEDSS